MHRPTECARADLAPLARVHCAARPGGPRRPLLTVAQGRHGCTVLYPVAADVAVAVVRVTPCELTLRGTQMVREGASMAQHVRVHICNGATAVSPQRIEFQPRAPTGGSPWVAEAGPHAVAASTLAERWAPGRFRSSRGRGIRNERHQPADRAVRVRPRREQLAGASPSRL